MNPRAEIGRERRRQIQVRKAFEAGLALHEQDAAELATFYLACGDYILWSMARLHDQDQKIHDLLKQRLEPGQVEVREQLATLDERQDKSRAFTAEFGSGVELLQRRGAVGCAEFETAARSFVELFTSLMAPRKNPFQEHTDRLFSEDDWIDIAGVTDKSLAAERELFDSVESTAPASIDPEEFTAAHGPG
jgi:hypothetical protein